MKAGTKNRDRLVHAAADLFWQNGYDGTSLADVAEAADIPVGNLYYYFRTKAALAIGACELMEREAIAALHMIESAHVDPRARLRALIELWAAANASRTQRGCPIAGATNGFRKAAPEASRIAARTFDRMRAWIAAELQGAGLTQDEARGQAEGWLSGWQGAITLAHALGDRAILDRALASLAQSVPASGDPDDASASPART